MKEFNIDAESKRLCMQALFGKFNPESPQLLSENEAPELSTEVNELLLDAYSCLTTTGNQEQILRICLSGDDDDAVAIARIVFAATIYQKNKSAAWLKIFRTPLDRWLSVFTNTENINNTIHRKPGKGKVWNDDFQPKSIAFTCGLMLGLFQAAVWRDKCLSSSGTFENDFVDFIIDIFPLNSDHYTDDRASYNPLFLKHEGFGSFSNSFK